MIGTRLHTKDADTSMLSSLDNLSSFAGTGSDRAASELDDFASMLWSLIEPAGRKAADDSTDSSQESQPASQCDSVARSTSFGAAPILSNTIVEPAQSQPVARNSYGANPVRGTATSKLPAANSSSFQRQSLSASGSTSANSTGVALNRAVTAQSDSALASLPRRSVVDERNNFEPASGESPKQSEAKAVALPTGSRINSLTGSIPTAPDKAFRPVATTSNLDSASTSSTIATRSYFEPRNVVADSQPNESSPVTLATGLARQAKREAAADAAATQPPTAASPIQKSTAETILSATIRTSVSRIASGASENLNYKPAKEASGLRAKNESPNSSPLSVANASNRSERFQEVSSLPASDKGYVSGKSEPLANDRVSKSVSTASTNVGPRLIPQNETVASQYRTSRVTDQSGQQVSEPKPLALRQQVSAGTNSSSSDHLTAQQKTSISNNQKSGVTVGRREVGTSPSTGLEGSTVDLASNVSTASGQPTSGIGAKHAELQTKSSFSSRWSVSHEDVSVDDKGSVNSSLTTKIEGRNSDKGSGSPTIISHISAHAQQVEIPSPSAAAGSSTLQQDWHNEKLTQPAINVNATTLSQIDSVTTKLPGSAIPLNFVAEKPVTYLVNGQPEATSGQFQKAFDALRDNSETPTESHISSTVTATTSAANDPAGAATAFRDASGDPPETVVASPNSSVNAPRQTNPSDGHEVTNPANDALVATSATYYPSADEAPTAKAVEANLPREVAMGTVAVELHREASPSMTAQPFDGIAVESNATRSVAATQPTLSISNQRPTKSEELSRPAAGIETDAHADESDEQTAEPVSQTQASDSISQASARGDIEGPAETTSNPSGSSVAKTTETHLSAEINAAAESDLPMPTPAAAIPSSGNAVRQTAPGLKQIPIAISDNPRGTEAPSSEPLAEAQATRTIQELVAPTQSVRTANLSVQLADGQTTRAIVREREGSVDVKIVTSNSAAAERVSSEIDNLRQNLDAAGLRLGQSEVSYQQERSGGGGRDEHQPQPQPNQSSGEIFTLSEAVE